MENLVRRSIISFILTLCFLPFLQGQNPENPLDDTYWKITLERGVGSVIAHYKEDSIFIADDFEDYFDQHTRYRVSEDTIFRQYILTIPCDSSIVGVFNYTMDEDVMKFKLISDECEIRAEELPLLIHTKLTYSLPINLEESAPLNFFTINTTADPIGAFHYTNNSFTWESPEFVIHDIKGNVVRSGILSRDGVFHFFQEEDGAYFLTILWKEGIETFKLFKLTTTNVIEPETSSAYNIYPNPSSSGKFSYENQHNNAQVSYRIYSVDGRYIESYILELRDRIDLSKEPSGIYYLIIEDAGKVEVLKLVK